MNASIEIMSITLKNNIAHYVHQKDVFNELFKAYNRYVEDETNGGDYIFNIEDKNNLSCCVNAGLTAPQIFAIVSCGCKYFFYGENYPTPRPLTSAEIEGIIMNNLDEVIRCVLAYPYVEEYRKIYTRFITNSIIGE